MGSVRAVPDTLNVTCVGGDDLRVLVLATYTDGTNVDWSGENLAQVRDHPTSDTVTLQLGALSAAGDGYPNGVYITADDNQTRGLLALGVDPLVPTAYYGYWDVQSTPVGGLTRTIASGAFIVNVDVTR